MTIGYLDAITLMQKVIAQENQLEHAAKTMAPDCNYMDISPEPDCFGYPDECKNCEVPKYYDFKIDQ